MSPLKRNKLNKIRSELDRLDNSLIRLIKKRTITGKTFYYLSKNKNLKDAAKNLYKILRMIKKKKFKRIAVEKIPNKGFGEAINDRLLRA